MKIKWLAVLLLVSTFAKAQTSDEQQIRSVLDTQRMAWNRGDIEGFMQTYLHSDSLMFIGKNGIQWGWQKTLENYKKSYPGAAAMGKLNFDLLVVKKLSDQYYYVVGKWMLTREAGDLSGHFDLLLQKINGRWFIISDHSS